VTALEIDTPHGPARVDVDFLTGPRPTGTFQEPSGELVAEKQQFGTSRRARWFNR
jgi:sulfide:quinone oxidoreductase